ncbi:MULTISPECIES: hypothetical protein [unclassified Streptomyces]|uniref:hypothetical protein n=1 Tax=unclassified Streptomyces TaxID=2593676 RepID=UPI002E2905CE|nr:hypothetical protein [Streptomyces sp. NBC_00228]
MPPTDPRLQQWAADMASLYLPSQPPVPTASAPAGPGTGTAALARLLATPAFVDQLAAALETHRTQATATAASPPAAPAGTPAARTSSATTTTARRPSTTPAKTTVKTVSTPPSMLRFPPGGLDLSGIRAAQAPPDAPYSARRFVTASSMWAWSHVDVGIPERHRWDAFVNDLTAASNLVSVRLNSAPPPGRPECAGLCTIRSGNGQSWAELYVDPRDSHDEQRRHVRHEVGHLIDVVASGERWPELGDAHRRPQSEAWAVRCETLLTSSVTVDQAITECRHFHAGRQGRHA